MAVVTLAIKRNLEDRHNAWFQVVDDINSGNIDTIKAMIENAILVKYDKFSNPFSVYENDYKSNIEKNMLDRAYTFALRSNLNDTQTKNIKSKISHWARNDFKALVDKLDNSTEYVSAIVISEKITKHEWLMLSILRDIGVNILVVTKDLSNISYASDIRQIKFGTNENLKVTNNTDNGIKHINNNSILIEENKALYNIDKELLKSDRLIDIVKDHSENIKVTVYGIEVEIDTRIIAARLKSICNNENNIFFINERIPKPTLDETSKIYRITRDNVDYVIHTLKNFIRCYDNSIADSVKELVGEELNKFKAAGDTSSIIYNKGTLLICWLNRYLKNKNTTIIFYGNPYGNEEILLNILSRMNSMNIIVLSANKQREMFKLDERFGVNIELNDSNDNTNIELVSTDTSTTLAYNASKIVDQTLYGENTVGLYREGQIIDCSTKHLACTFDETVMWWNKEMFIRPGYKQFKNSVEIPVQFGIVRGLKGSGQDYIKTVQRYCCGKTTIYRENNFYPKFNNQIKEGMYIHNCTDINGTMFSEQKPFIVGDKVQSQLIKNSRNFKYSFLDEDKQNFILSKIQEIIDDKMISKPHHYKNDKNQFYNMVLGLTLNMDIEIIRAIQWFNYTEYNPNIVVISNTENTLTFEDTIYLRFLSKLGFDIIIFIPTLYSSIEKFLNNTEYESYTIGRADYSVDLSSIKVIKDENFVQKQTTEKKGWFSKLFN